MITAIIVGLILVPVVYGLVANYRKWSRDPMRPLSDEWSAFDRDHKILQARDKARRRNG